MSGNLWPYRLQSSTFKPSTLKNSFKLFVINVIFLFTAWAASNRSIWPIIWPFFSIKIQDVEIGEKFYHRDAVSIYPLAVLNPKL